MCTDWITLLHRLISKKLLFRWVGGIVSELYDAWEFQVSLKERKREI